MKKGDVRMAKRFSKKYGNKGWASTTCNSMSRCLSAPDATSLHHCNDTAYQLKEGTGFPKKIMETSNRKTIY